MEKEKYEMQGQGKPFNSDSFVEAKILELKDKYNITCAIETGTHLGYTTEWLAQNFSQVYTIESNQEYRVNSHERLAEHKNCIEIAGKSQTQLDELIHNKGFHDKNVLFFLDAHWENECPLIEELRAIAKKNHAKEFLPVIVIHDFVVPRAETLGFDEYKGQPLNFEYIEHSVKAIYGDKFNIEYNSDEKSEGAKRGVIYITPKK